MKQVIVLIWLSIVIMSALGDGKETKRDKPSTKNSKTKVEHMSRRKAKSATGRYTIDIDLASAEIEKVTDTIERRCQYDIPLGLPDNEGGIVMSSFEEDKHCRYKIIPPIGKVVRIWLKFFSLGENDDCGDSFFTISDGDDETIANLCGRIEDFQNNSFISKGATNIHVQIIANNFEYQGFALLVSLEDESLSSINPCHEIYELNESHGSLSFVSDESKFNQSCRWSIGACSSKEIQVIFGPMSIEGNVDDSNECTEFLQIGDNRLCGTYHPDPFTIPSCSVVVAFVSSSKRSQRSFSVAFKQVDAVDACDRTQDPVLITENGHEFSFPADGGKYKRNSRCDWIIRLPDFPSIYIEVEPSIENHHECAWDYLTVTTADGSLKHKICGDTIYREEIMANEVHLNFVSDNSLQKDGFKIKISGQKNGYCPYWHLYSSDETCAIDADCEGLDKCCPNDKGSFCMTPLDGHPCNGGNPLELTGDHGYIKHPLNGLNYENNEKCHWKIKNVDGTPMSVQIRIQEMDLEMYSLCSYDKLLIDDTSYCKSANAFFGHDEVIQSVGDIEISFLSDGSVNAKGFMIYYEKIQDDIIDPCGDMAPRILEHDKGTISHPVNQLKYANGESCEWAFSFESKLIELDFDPDTFAVEKHSKCLFDALDIYSKGKIILSLCNGNIDQHPKISLCSSDLRLHFRSDFSVRLKGFNINYEVIGECQKDPCQSEVELNGNSGEIIQGPYYENSLCQWKIIGDPAMIIEITFTSIELELNQGKDCTYDYLTLSTDPIHYYKVCNDNIPKKPIRIPYKNIYVQFISDESYQGNGFILAYKMIDPQSEGQGGINDAACVSSLSFTEDNGEIKFPATDEDYANNLNCVWNIEVASGKHIILSFENLDLEGDAGECSFDNVTVYAGGIIADTLCGSKNFTKTYSSNSIKIELQTDFSTQGQGFLLKWKTEEKDGDDEEDDEEDDNGECGKRRGYSVSSFIISGTETTSHTWPWIAGIYIDGNSHICGAAVIDKKWIVTAAHCLEGYTANRVTILVGDHLLSSANLLKVEKLTTHEHFVSSSLLNDIGLIKLEEELEFNDYIQPVCLSNQHPEADTGHCYIIGWGATTADTNAPNPYPNTLHEASIYPLSSCRQTGAIPETEFCAGTLSGTTKDACYGDSGGPMHCKNEDDGSWYLAGITSWGYGCGEHRYPGVYTKVMKYLDWIKENKI